MGSATPIRTVSWCETIRPWNAFGLWQYHRRGRMSGSAAGRMVTSKLWVLMPPAVASTDTTTSGVASETERSFCASRTSPARCRSSDQPCVATWQKKVSAENESWRRLSGSWTLDSFVWEAKSTRHEHETFGVASLRKDHVRIHNGVMEFEYPAKGSIDRSVKVQDAQALDVVSTLRRRRSGGSNLFAYKQERRWIEVHASDVNDYIKAIVGEEFSAEDFRTWSATVLAAAALAENQSDPEAAKSKRRAVSKAIAKVADTLGNTPAVSRSSYVDPRVVDRFEEGETVTDTLGHQPDAGSLAHRDHDARGYRAVENAVIGLLDDTAS